MVMIDLAAGEQLGDHGVHERAIIHVARGSVELTSGPRRRPAARARSSCSSRASATPCALPSTRASCSRSLPGRPTATTTPPRPGRIRTACRPHDRARAALGRRARRRGHGRVHRPRAAAAARRRRRHRRRGQEPDRDARRRPSTASPRAVAAASCAPGDVVEVAEGESLRVVASLSEPALTRLPTTRSTRRSGTNQMTATATKSAIETHGITNASAERDDVEQQRDPALAVVADGLRELRARLVQGEQREREQRERDRAAEQHDRVGGDRPRLDARPRPARRSPSGISESQKSRCMLAHSVRPSIVLTTCIRWWWLFQ